MRNIIVKNTGIPTIEVTKPIGRITPGMINLLITKAVETTMAPNNAEIGRKNRGASPTSCLATCGGIIPRWEEGRVGKECRSGGSPYH